MPFGFDGMSNRTADSIRTDSELREKEFFVILEGSTLCMTKQKKQSRAVSEFMAPGDSGMQRVTQL